MKNITSQILYKLWPVALLLSVILSGLSVWLNLSPQVVPQVGIPHSHLSSMTTSPVAHSNTSDTTLSYYPLNHALNTLEFSPPNASQTQTLSFTTVKIDATNYDLDVLTLEQNFNDIKDDAYFNHLLEHEAFLYQAINSKVTFIDTYGNQYPVRFADRTLWSASFVFWLHPLLAVLVIWIAIATIHIGGFGRYHLVNLGASISLALYILLAVSAFDRVWALPSTLIFWSFYLSNLALRLFIFFALYILWEQPYKIGRSWLIRHLPWFILIAMILPWCLQVTGIYQNFAWNITRSVLICSVATIIAVYGQWTIAHSNSANGQHLVNQIMLRLLVATIVVCTIFGLGLNLSLMSGILTSLGPSIFSALVAMVFMLGITALLLRKELYRLQTWWWRAWGLLAAIGVGFVVFISFVNFEIELTLTISFVTLISVVFTYFIFSTIYKNRYAKQESHFMQQAIPQLVDVVANFSNPKVAHKKWCRILEYSFQPTTLLSLDNSNYHSHSLPYHSVPYIEQPEHKEPFESAVLNVDNECPVTICDDGASMMVLGFNGEKVLLQGAAASMRLFSRADKERVRLLWVIASQGQKAQSAYLEGENQERGQIAIDLQEDIGRKLVHMISIGGEHSEHSRYAQDTLQNLQMLTQGLYVQSLSIAELLADMNYYFAKSCDIEGMNYLTDIDIPNLLDHVPSSQSTTFFAALLHELLRNAFQHDKADTISLKIHDLDNKLYITVSNNGRYTDPTSWRLGLGITSIKRRVNDISGHIEWISLQEGGIVCQVSFSIDKWLG